MTGECRARRDIASPCSTDPPGGLHDPPHHPFCSRGHLAIDTGGGLEPPGVNTRTDAPHFPEPGELWAPAPAREDEPSAPRPRHLAVVGRRARGRRGCGSPALPEPPR